LRTPGDSLIWRIGKLLLSKTIIKKYNVEFKGSFPEPPFLLLANHTHFLDAFFIMAVIDFPIVWVAATGTFQNRLLGPVLKATKMISKQKGRPDASTIRDIYKVLEKGGIVGIFPEGSVTWDGEFQKLPKGTEKLLQRMKVPIVAAKVFGGYLTKPRWAEFGRRGKVEIEFKVLESSDALDFLRKSEWEWQKNNKIRFIGKNKAKGIERIIWFCPKCENFNSIISKGDSAYCLNCGFKITVDDFGYANGQTMSEILKQQEKFLVDNVNENRQMNLEKGTLRMRNLSDGHIVKVIRGQVSITESSIKVGDFEVPYSKISGETTFLRRIFEFIYEDKVMRLFLNKYSLMLFKFLENLRGGNIVFWNGR